MEPELLKGGLSVDDRGEVGFVNGFDFAGVRRFYTVSNHVQGFVRAWHGHRRETKHVFVGAGAALVCCLEPDDWDAPSVDLPIHRFVLSERAPAVLRIPAGFVNGFMTLAPGTKLTFFSSSTLEDSLGDDIRFPARYWDPWGAEER